ncbi:hypothetical protein AMATHDRAFT_134703 [Amanita thiersii Skay4041]|uniref:RNA-dependent RNA polymerase n=1 Tax=Amanita thiersii Skay4041 TaxID=703135 RepID=A0A2A9P1I8_9AGAR|nr:hypothetical protein AMATHDRAFT_134703 [Amanita thiersii Skay4041]
MEIFMCNVSWNADEHQVTRELASILHSPHYEQLIPRMNFNVHLFRDKTRIHSHRGMGFLTLPTENIGNEFLSDYGDMSCKSLIFYGRRIKFSKSQRSGCNPELLKTITLKPYMDPQYLKERESKAQRLKAGYIQLKTIQFGWMCRDDVFSIEWESHSSIISTLSFDPDRSEIRIVLEQPRSPDQYTIAIRYNQISFVSAYHHSEEPTVYLSLSQPPRFEHQYPNTLCQRLSHLPFGDHDRVAPYTSIAIRLICSGNGDITRFNYLFQEANLHTKIDDYFLPTDHRELFSRRSIEQYDEWIESLPWIVAFQVEAIVRNLIADFCEILSLKGNILEVINRYGDAYAAELLKHFSTHVNDALLAYNDTEANVHMYFQKLQNDYQGFRIMQPLQPTDASLFQALHVTITPTTMQLSGPFLERSNRVIRSYPPPMHDSFLRVNFNDEGGLFFRFDRDIDGPKFIRNRIGSLLFKGLLIAGRLFRFLAYSQSSLKEHSVWFVKDFTDQNNRPVTAAIIIANLGRFTDLQFDSKLIYCPARYAARLSQAFTATDASVAVELEEIQPIDDIQTEDGKYTFTDGVGTISTDLARDMWKELKKTRRKARASKAHPKAFQIRFQGSKGMLSINYKLSGHTLCLRPSMIKFEDPHSMQIEIAQAFDRPSDYFLNRPLITLLEGLGVPFETFKRYQDIAVKQTEAAVTSVGTAAKMLESHGLGSPFRVPSTLLSLKKHVTDNLHFDPFYRKSMEVAVYHILRELKNHARIPVPGGWTLVGVADEHGYLKEGEIFACVKPRMGRVQYLEGSILISRSPTIHPGDIQIVRAIGPPPRGSCFERESLENTVVFSIQGMLISLLTV